jgi:Flp pilus assembly protein TadG
MRQLVARALRPAAAFGRSCRAATSVELAIIGPFFILLVLMVIENGMMLFAQSVLDEAVVQAARQIQIGNVNSSSSFRTAICNYTSTLFTCANLQFYVASSPLGFPPPVMPLSNGTFLLPVFSTGNPNDFVVAEVAYNRAYIAPWLVTLGKSWTLLSTSAFQNEPAQ